MSKFEEIANRAKEKVNEAVDTAKNYDYKSKAEELKEKATEIADKAKEYDYKEKAKEVTEAVKNFDYEGKAKEISETVKNYDYKAEAENIKKGGLKYFLKKHKILAGAFAVVLFAIVVFVNVGDKDAATNKNDTNVSSDSQIEYKTKLSNEEITNIAIMTFEASYMSPSTPQFIGSEIIGQDKYGRCAAILEYDLGGIKGRRKYYVFADGLTKDGKVMTSKGIVEESMNNSELFKSTIETRKEQFGWNTPR